MTDSAILLNAEQSLEAVGDGQNAPTDVPRKQVLHVGCGPKADKKLFSAFRGSDWREVRLDIDPKVAPDIVGSIVDMRGSVSDGSYDAIWSSHNLEHLDGHDVSKALAEFVRILRPTGFALITCPDLVEIANRIVNGQLETELYTSPAGPVTPLDMLYGCGPSIAGGNRYMRHHTGFSQERLGRLLVEAGFAEVRVTRGLSFDLWALAMLPECDPSLSQQMFGDMF